MFKVIVVVHCLNVSIRGPLKAVNICVCKIKILILLCRISAKVVNNFVCKNNRSFCKICLNKEMICVYEMLLV